MEPAVLLHLRTAVPIRPLKHLGSQSSSTKNAFKCAICDWRAISLRCASASFSVPNSLDATEPPWSNMFWTIRVVKFFASRYQSQLPSEETLKNQIERELKALRDEK
jgi:hypothetical protein